MTPDLMESGVERFTKNALAPVVQHRVGWAQRRLWPRGPGR